MRNITNPSFVTTLLPFTLYTSRNNFLIDNLTNNEALAFSTTPEDLVCTVTPSNREAGVSNVSYLFSVTSVSEMNSSSILTFTFPDVAQVGGRTLSCSNGCGLSVSDSVVTVINFVIGSSVNNVSFSIRNLMNVHNLGETDSILVSLFTENNQLIEHATSGVTFTIEGRKLPSSNIAITSTNRQVNEFTNLTLSIDNQNPIPDNSIIRIITPSELTLSSNPQCQPSCVLNSSNTIDISVSAATSNLSSVILQSIRNPTSTQPTNSF